MGLVSPEPLAGLVQTKRMNEGNWKVEFPAVWEVGIYGKDIIDQDRHIAAAKWVRYPEKTCGHQHIQNCSTPESCEPGQGYPDRIGRSLCIVRDNAHESIP